MLAEINQKVYDKNELLLVQEVALSHEMLDIVLHSHSCVLHHLIRLELLISHSLYEVLLVVVNKEVEDDFSSLRSTF